MYASLNILTSPRILQITIQENEGLHNTIHIVWVNILHIFLTKSINIVLCTLNNISPDFNSCWKYFLGRGGEYFGSTNKVVYRSLFISPQATLVTSQILFYFFFFK